MRALDPAFDAAPRELVTVAEAEAVAEALLQRCEALHTVLITSLAGHVLRQRGVPIPRGHATLVEACPSIEKGVCVCVRELNSKLYSRDWREM